jgi:type I restriction enzyme, S subunit
MSDAVNSISQEEWTKVILGDIAKNISENEYKPKEKGLDRCIGLEHLDPGSLKIRRWSPITPEMSFTRRFSKGQILFGKRRAYQKKVALADFDGICSSDILVIEAKKENFVQEILPFIIQDDRFFEFAVGTSSGSLSPRTKWKFLADYEIWLPSLDEQSRIATTLWAAEDCIEKGNWFLEKIIQLKRLFLNELFMRGIGHTEFKDTTLGILPKSWDTLTFENAVSIETGQIDPTLDKYKKMIHIGSENIESGTGVLSPLETNEKLGISSGNYCFTPSHILYSKIRPYFKKAAYPKIYGTCSADIYPLRCNEIHFVNSFVFQYLLSEQFNTQVISYQNRTGMPKINRDELNSIIIPKPSLIEQHQIAAILIHCDEMISTARVNVTATKALKMKLIKELFSRR